MEQERNNGKRRRSLPLFWQITAWTALTLLLVLSLTLVLTLNGSLQNALRSQDNLLFSTVKTLVESPSIGQTILTGECDEALITYLDSVVYHTDTLDILTIADADSKILYHADHSYIGRYYMREDQARALAGEFYLSDSNGELGFIHQALGPVTDQAGNVIGFVIAGTTQNLMAQLRRDVYVGYVRLFAILMGCALILTGVLVLYLKKNLRGTRTDDIPRLFLTQNDILNALDEGLVAVDAKGRICLVNRAATESLGLREELLLGKNIDEVILDARRQSLRNATGAGLHTNRPNVLVSAVGLPDSNAWARQVLILLDKSEASRYAEQLVGTRHIINTLRANNHEFLNKLQVISGLLQMGFTDDVQDYIGDISAEHSRGVGMVMQHINNPNIAALLLGKLGNMRELGIDMTLLANSSLPERSRFLSTGELVTVVGNLLENAMEAVDAAGGDNRSIVLQITEDERSLVILVSDSGVGIREEDLPRIFDQGFSTKASQGRGVGMALIHDIVEHRGGSIEVDTDPGSGTNFTLIFDKERGDSL